MKCTKCNTETDYNYGSRADSVLCENCAKSEVKFKNNIISSSLRFFGFLFSALTILGIILSAMSMQFEKAIYILLSGVVVILILFGISEIIRQLVKLNQKE